MVRPNSIFQGLGLESLEWSKAVVLEISVLKDQFYLCVVFFTIYNLLHTDTYFKYNKHELLEN